jgi:hypothetical protein
MTALPLIAQGMQSLEFGDRVRAELMTHESKPLAFSVSATLQNQI